MWGRKTTTGISTTKGDGFVTKSFKRKRASQEVFREVTNSKRRVIVTRKFKGKRLDGGQNLHEFPLKLTDDRGGLPIQEGLRCLREIPDCITGHVWADSPGLALQGFSHSPTLTPPKLLSSVQRGELAFVKNNVSGCRREGCMVRKRARLKSRIAL